MKVPFRVRTKEGDVVEGSIGIRTLDDLKDIYESGGDKIPRMRRRSNNL
jgi:hypothetical protein